MAELSMIRHRERTSGKPDAERARAAEEAVLRDQVRVAISLVPNFKPGVPHKLDYRGAAAAPARRQDMTDKRLALLRKANARQVKEVGAVRTLDVYVKKSDFAGPK
jgi:hypothetical protein